VQEEGLRVFREFHHEQGNRDNLVTAIALVSVARTTERNWDAVARQATVPEPHSMRARIASVSIPKGRQKGPGPRLAAGRTAQTAGPIDFMPRHGRSEGTGYKEELDRKVSRSLPQMPHSA
jgi:hypothetical protein